MSFKRRQVTRTDLCQASIIEALEKVGCRVYVIGWPCDLLVHTPWERRIGEWGIGRFHCIEVKTATKAGKPRLDKRQKAQAAFLAETGTPVVTNPIEALRALHLIEFNLESG